jgi:hypothetical protein
MGKLASIKPDCDLIALTDKFDARKKEYDNFHYRLVGELLTSMCILEELMNSMILGYPIFISEAYKELEAKELLHAMDSIFIKKKILNKIFTLPSTKIEPKRVKFFNKTLDELGMHRNFCAHSSVYHPYGEASLDVTSPAPNEFTKIRLEIPSIKPNAKGSRILIYTLEMHKKNINNICILMNYL